MRTLTCPKCSARAVVPDGQKPACSACGFGSSQAPHRAVSGRISKTAKLGIFGVGAIVLLAAIATALVMTGVFEGYSSADAPSESGSEQQAGANGGTPKAASVVVKNPNLVDNVAGYRNLVLEVHNDGSEAAKAVQVRAVLIRADGSVFETTRTSVTPLWTIEPGDFSPMGFYFEDENGEVADWDLIVESFESEPRGRAGKDVLEIRNDVGSVDPQSGWYQVDGEVVNTGTVDLREVNVVAAFYNVDGKLVAFANAGSDTVRPHGDSEDFRAWTDYPKGAEISSYELWVECSWTGLE